MGNKKIGLDFKELKIGDFFIIISADSNFKNSSSLYLKTDEKRAKRLEYGDYWTLLPENRVNKVILW